jgi:hypothetical protein
MISRGVERVIETNGEYSFELMIDPESIRDWWEYPEGGEGGWSWLFPPLYGG